MPGGPSILTLDFWIAQSGSHLLINLIWDIVFGAIFARVYNLVPGKGVIKGLIYGLSVFLIATFQYQVWFGSMAVFHNAYELATANVWGIFVGFFSTGIAFGLVLGALYRKPSD